MSIFECKTMHHNSFCFGFGARRTKKKDSNILNNTLHTKIYTTISALCEYLEITMPVYVWCSTFLLLFIALCGTNKKEEPSTHTQGKRQKIPEIKIVLKHRKLKSASQTLQMQTQ